MSTEHYEQRRLLALLGEYLARLTPLVEKAGPILDRRGSKRLLAAIDRNVRYSRAVLEVVEQYGDYAPPQALAEAIRRDPVLMAEEAPPSSTGFLRVVGGTDAGRGA